MIEHRLLAVETQDYTEKKNGLTYLSWAQAWAQALLADHEANFRVEMFDGKPYMEINGTAMVWVSVSLGGRVRTCWLPVMNSQNAPISVAGRTFKDKYGNDKVEKLDSFNVNTAIMRCLTKCLGMFGLGLNVYAGEDLPLVENSKAEPKEAKPEAPKAEPPNAETPKAPKISEKEKEDLTLFADGLLEYLVISKDEQGLRSYWKRNEARLEELKAKIPDLYELVREKFTATKVKMQEKTSE